MAVRAIWKGHLRLDLVSCAVQMSTAVSEGGKIAFRTLNRATGNPVKIQWVDSVTEEPVEDKVKGFELERDEYLLIEDKEIDEARVEGTKTLTLGSFIDQASVPSMFFDTPYFMTPRDAASAEAFALIRDAMARQKVAALTCIVLYRKQRQLLIEPSGDGMIATTLIKQNEVIDPKEVFGGIEKTAIDPDMVALASSIMDQKSGHFDPSAFDDEYENALIELVRAKQAGKSMPTARKESGSNVTDLMAALKRSVAAEGGKVPSLREAAKRRTTPRVSARR